MGEPRARAPSAWAPKPAGARVGSCSLEPVKTPGASNSAAMDVVLDVTTPASELPAPKPITVLGSMIEEYGLGRYQRGLIVLLGMVLMGDGMEMYVPSLVVPELPADWELGSIEKGLLGSGAAFGMWIASAFMGSLSDQFGRTPVLSAASAVAFLAAALCAVAETWVQWLLLRILFGVGVGSILPITIVMLNECVASRLLARVIALTWLFFSLGAMLAAALSWIFLATLGWRFVVAISALPLAVGAFASVVLVESPRWLLSTGRAAAAELALARMARVNGQPPPPSLMAAAIKVGGEQPATIRATSSLMVGGEQPASAAAPAGVPRAAEAASGPAAAAPRASASSQATMAMRAAAAALLELCGAEHGRTTVYVSAYFFAASFMYYGTIFVLPGWLKAHTSDPSTGASEEYAGAFYGAASELPGCFVAAVLPDLFGRKKVLLGCAALAAAGSFGAALCAQTGLGWGWIESAVCVLKAASSGGFTVAFVYCSEAYPTRVRNVAVAFCNSFARLAAIVAPLVGQLLLDDVSSLGTFGTFGFFGLVATLAALRLPFETLGRDADLCARAAGGGGDLEDHESTKLINPLW